MSLRGRQHRLRAGRRQAGVLQSRRHVDARAVRAAAAISAACAPTSTADEGVCVTMQPCSQDSDCPNPVRSTCAATFLNELYSKIRTTPTTLRHSDHLYCLQRDCVKGGSSCGPGAVVPAACWSRRRPTRPTSASPTATRRTAARRTTSASASCPGSGSPRICLPGLLGFLCESDIDCMVGKCISDDEPDEGLRLNLCTVPCSNDDDCEKLRQRSGEVRLPAGRHRQRPLRDARRLPRRALLRRRRLHARRGNELRVLQQADVADRPGHVQPPLPRRHGTVHAARRIRPRLPAVHGRARRHVEARLLPRLLRPPLHRRRSMRGRPEVHGALRRVAAEDLHGALPDRRRLRRQSLDRRQCVLLLGHGLRVASCGKDAACAANNWCQSGLCSNGKCASPMIATETAAARIAAAAGGRVRARRAAHPRAPARRSPCSCSRRPTRTPTWPTT